MSAATFDGIAVSEGEGEGVGVGDGVGVGVGEAVTDGVGVVGGCGEGAQPTAESPTAIESAVVVRKTCLFIVVLVRIFMT
ncbi:hypothetical protein [Tessaracoccus caeni]|uniref:hypothetical protein n=1 Tax=Tessaracoccus caeni TaxID=3031239 RepID=UPI0023D9CA3A|nr:hypothetical protein [Tessaracoccus caeni]MDF1489946.1 hypothetical protein [Tessaracoccus caeni]